MLTAAVKLSLVTTFLKAVQSRQQQHLLLKILTPNHLTMKQKRRIQLTNHYQLHLTIASQGGLQSQQNLRVRRKLMPAKLRRKPEHHLQDLRVNSRRERPVLLHLSLLTVILRHHPQDLMANLCHLSIQLVLHL